MILYRLVTTKTTWDPENYARNARFVSVLGDPLLTLLSARPGEVILDLGCGDGALTEKIAASGGLVCAVDSSWAQAAAARRRGLSALVMDAQALGFKRRFDAVLTNAVLHWLEHPERAVAGVAACLHHGGRFVGEFGGKGNVETIRAALHANLSQRGVDPWSVDPWYYPSVEEFSPLLRRFDFTIASIDLIPRPTKLPGDITAWLEIFAQPFTKALPETERGDYLAKVRDELRPKLRDREGGWQADYVRLRFKALRR